MTRPRTARSTRRVGTPIRGGQATADRSDRAPRAQRPHRLAGSQSGRSASHRKASPTPAPGDLTHAPGERRRSIAPVGSLSPDHLARVHRNQGNWMTDRNVKPAIAQPNLPPEGVDEEARGSSWSQFWVDARALIIEHSREGTPRPEMEPRLLRPRWPGLRRVRVHASSSAARARLPCPACLRDCRLALLSLCLDRNEHHDWEPMVAQHVRIGGDLSREPFPGSASRTNSYRGGGWFNGSHRQVGRRVPWEARGRADSSECHPDVPPSSPPAPSALPEGRSHARVSDRRRDSPCQRSCRRAHNARRYQVVIATLRRVLVNGDRQPRVVEACR
jgi:hypothetical protein